MRGKPTVASNKSSIPEIAGSAAVYVNPKSVESIYMGIMQMIERYQKMCIYAEKRREIVVEMVKLDNTIMIDDLLLETK